MTNRWPSIQLGDVCTIISGQSPKAIFYNEDGQGLPFYQGKKEFTKRLIGQPKKWTTFVTKEAIAGDVLMSVRAPVGPINQATEKICIGRGLAAIRPHEEVSRDYLWYALSWLQPTIRGNAGAVFESINNEGIENLRIPLPPLEKQRRIVAILDEAFEGLDRACAHAEANFRDGSEMFESFLTDLFTDPDPSWKTTQLSAFCEKITVGHVGPMAKRYVASGIPFLRSQNVRPFEIDLTDVKYIDDKFMRELKKSELRPGDVAIVRTGYPGT